MGNMRSGPCLSLSFTCQPLPAARTTEIEVLVNKWMPHFIELQSGKKPRRNHTDLHAFICVDSAALHQVNGERFIDGPQRRRVLLQRRTRGGPIRFRRRCLAQEAAVVPFICAKSDETGVSVFFLFGNVPNNEKEQCSF